MEQTIEAPSAVDAAQAEKQRTWVRDHYDPAAQAEYETVEGKLRLLETIIEAKWVSPTETWKLQGLGITFGDALAQKMGLVWVAVEDAWSRSGAA